MNGMTTTELSEPVPPTERPPTPGDLAWIAAITAAKGAVIALAIDAFLNSSAPRYHGKGMRLRAIGYTGGLLIAPVAWRIRGRKEPYPRELDMAITIPLLIDAGGNAIGMYRSARMDDLVHFLDGAIVSSVVGALATPRTKTSWEAAGVGGRSVGGTASDGSSVVIILLMVPYPIRCERRDSVRSCTSRLTGSSSSRIRMPCSRSSARSFPGRW